MKERDLIALKLRDFSKMLTWLFVIVDVFIVIGTIASTYKIFKYGDSTGNFVAIVAMLIIFITIILSQAIMLYMAKGVAELLCPKNENEEHQEELRVKVNLDEPFNAADTLASV